MKHEYKENSIGRKFFWADMVQWNIFDKVLKLSLLSSNLSDSYSLPKF